jgi:hypothetical protein
MRLIPRLAHLCGLCEEPALSGAEVALKPIC